MTNDVRYDSITTVHYRQQLHNKKGIKFMWITHPECGTQHGKFEFTKRFSLDSIPQGITVDICADTKYRLFINGTLAAFGPCKKSEVSAFYDIIDITGYLKTGENEICAEVLHLPAQEETRDGFVYYPTLLRTAFCAFMLHCSALNISTDTSWNVSKCSEYSIALDQPNILSGGFEYVDYNNVSREFVPSRILLPSGLDSPFTFGGEFFQWHLIERPIPMLKYIRREFVNPPADTSEFVLNAGYENTGSLVLNVSGEKGSEIKITYAESYYQRDEKGNYYKDIRDDESGVLSGHYDKIILDGMPHTFETFYIRAFRFIKIEITGNARVESAYYNEIKYPLTVEAKFSSDDNDAQALWDVSIRTLNNCMHDSFEDCPYYEQLQYAMDSRLQAIFLRQLTNDRRLIKKCICDFRESVFPDGMIQARTPSARQQIIPGFALHYIFMIYDYMRYDGDENFIRSLIPTVDGIVTWYDSQMKDGIVGKVGYWNYVDWAWPSGVPANGALSVYSFMYIVALDNAASLAHFVGRDALAEEYSRKADTLRIRCKEVFYDEDRRLFRDIPEGGFSMHSQIWATLAGSVCGSEAKDLLIRTLDDDSLPICTHSMMFFVFRALDKAGIYDRAYKLLDKWREMLNKHCTTWVENGLDGRSECHAWGSAPIYEFTASVLGVRPFANGYRSIMVAPYVGSNEHAEGTVMTTHGKVHVKWYKKDGKLILSICSEADVPVYVMLPDMNTYKMNGSKQTFVYKMK